MQIPAKGNNNSESYAQDVSEKGKISTTFNLELVFTKS